MSNPYRVPRPHPISADVIDDGWTVDHYLEPQRLNSLLDQNAEWLCDSEHSTRDIYTALFRLIDPRMMRQQEGMRYICGPMWDLGYRPTKSSEHSANPVWKWAVAS